MKRFSILGVLAGALVFGTASTSQAYYPYFRPVPRVAARVALPPFGPRVYGPRVYGPRAFYGPGYYAPRAYVAPYRAWGPGFYGPRVGIGIY